MDDPQLRGLRRERLRAGLTQQQLADLAGTMQHTVSDAESLKRLPRTATVYKFSDALGVPMEALFAPEPARSHLDILSEAVEEMEDLETVAERLDDPLEGMQAATVNARAAVYAAFQLERAVATNRVIDERLKEAFDLMERFLNLSIRNAAQAQKALRKHRRSPDSKVLRDAPEPEIPEHVGALLEEADSALAGMRP